MVETENDFGTPPATDEGAPPYTYSWDFDYGLGPWTTWFSPSVVNEPGGQIENFTRLQASGLLDANHIDGIGAIWLMAHLSTPTLGSPGALNLQDAEFSMTVRSTDFDPNGGQLAIWICRYVPETGLMENFTVGLQVTNWANTGTDLLDQISDEWTTVTLRISNDPADWTYAGNYQSMEGDWADRYMPFDLQETLSNVNATLHLVVLNPDPDNAPTGFLDLANITVSTHTPATPDGLAGSNPEVHHGLEDQVATGRLAGSDSVDMANATFSLVADSATNGVATIDPATGAFTFTPPADWYGPTYNQGYATFRYTVSDGVTTSEPITVVVYIGGVNDAPELTTRSEDAELIAGQPFSFSLFKGSDVDGDQLTFKVVADSVVGGTLTLDARTGRYVFTPDEGFTGAASFRYTVSDGQLDSAEKTVTLNVHAAGDPPPVMTFDDAVNFLIAGDLEQWQYWVVRLADTDPNAAYHYATWLNDGINGATLNWDLARHYYEAALGATPDVNLRLATLYVGGMGGERDYAGARALLEALPDNPVAIFRLAILNDLGFGAPVDKALAVEGYIQAAKMGNMEAAWNLGRRYLAGEGVDASPEDAYFWIGLAVKSNVAPNYGVQTLLQDNMALAAGSLTPEQITALDAAIADWTVGDASPVNDAPVLTGEDTIVPPAADGGLVTGTLALARDADGDRLTYELVDGSALNGTVTINPATGAFVFTPTPGYSGSAGFTYVVSDGQTTSTPRTVNFPVDTATFAAADSGDVDENAILTVAAAQGLLANDSAGQDATLGVTAVNGLNTNVGAPVVGAWGVLIVNADGSYVFTPSAKALTLLQGQTATDTFTYTATDSEGVSVGATLTITINGLAGTVIEGTGVVIGSAFDDALFGGVGRDVLIGLDGDDRLIGGDGVPDELYGGRGDDTYVVDTVGDSIVELEGEGFDTVETSAAVYTLPANVEALTFTGVGDFTGTGNALDNVITGGAGADILFGLDGADILRGGGGLDVLHGGRGDDTYIVESAGDVTVELAGEGIDTVLTALPEWTLGANVENLTYLGTGAFTGRGNASNNTITGGAGDDVLSGGAGTDTLIGGGGRDTADYADALTGVDVRLNGGVTRNDGFGGTDTLIGIENVTGSAFDDLLIGDAGSNVLRGGLGRDTLIGMDGDDVLDGGAGLANTLQGGRGDDLYIVSAIGDSIVEFAGEGYDTIQTSLGSLRMAVHVEELIYTGSGTFFGQGNAGDNVIRGGLGRDTLMGHDGNDILIGGDGAPDELHGGAGDDIYVITSGGDTIVEYADGGFDTVQTTLSSYALRLNVEALTYIGDGDFTGTGTSEDNVLTGGAGNDLLKGGGGNDTLIGGDGIDIAVLTGLRDDYLLEQIDGGWRVTDRISNRDGVDVLYGIETLRFGDGQTFDLTAPATNVIAGMDKASGPLTLPGESDPIDTGARLFDRAAHQIAAPTGDTMAVHPGDGWDVLI
ncbi:Ig-like domain-containing protein [Brevundimonas sp. M20]|uniref:tandem-95 repeat protein n=1 Tax=Brevundimonas sp. M20 TaxID=2591463 RepID=UPI0011465877|nr:Ig-like domain-containing protein [Brevundimonas sp. M20]QDH72526.1 tandem-95 repeat protein [Brevundimonas sp. M20]